MEHAGFSAKKELRSIHRKWARVLAKDIKAAMPKTGSLTAGTAQAGGSVRKRISKAKKRSGWKKTGSAHDTPRGAMARSVKTFASTGSAGVTGGDTRAPHYAVNEFGGAVWWRARKGGVRLHAKPARRPHRSYAEQFAKHGGKTGHIIPVRNRSRAFNRGVEGWFFYPTIYKKLDTLENKYFKDLDKHVTSELKKLSYAKH